MRWLLAVFGIGAALVLGGCGSDEPDVAPPSVPAETTSDASSVAGELAEVKERTAPHDDRGEVSLTEEDPPGDRSPVGVPARGGSAIARLLLVRPAEPRDVVQPAAVVDGVLTADTEIGCAWLDGYPVVWPNGTTATETPPEIHLPDGQLVRPGEHVRAGGGYFQIDSMARTVAHSGLDAEKARACLIGPTNEVAVINNYGDITVTTPIDADPRPPGTVLLSEAGRQQARQASYCVIHADKGGICADTPGWEPRRYSIARPGDTVTVAVLATTIRYGGRLTIWDTERRRAHHIQRLTAPRTDVVLDLPPGLYTLDVFAPFTSNDGWSGTTSAVLGIAVTRGEEPRILGAKKAATLVGRPR